jgi:hypothetical protein
MKFLRHLTSIVAATVLASLAHGVAAEQSAPAAAEAKIPPPFGLKWGETSERLERLLTGAKATIEKRTKKEEAEIWEVVGLVQTGLKTTVFEFHKGALTRVSLVYERTEWAPNEYLKFYGEIRSRIAQKYQEPVREITEASPEAGKAEEDGKLKLREAAWTRDDTGIRLVYLQSKGEAPTGTLTVDYTGAPPAEGPAAKAPGAP